MRPWGRKCFNSKAQNGHVITTLHDLILFSVLKVKGTAVKYPLYGSQGNAKQLSQLDLRVTFGKSVMKLNLQPYLINNNKSHSLCLISSKTLLPTSYNFNMNIIAFIRTLLEMLHVSLHTRSLLHFYPFTLEIPFMQFPNSSFGR